MDLPGVALEDRPQGACNVERIPTGKFPVYGITLRKTILTGETFVEFEFDAQRDTLFTNMSYNGAEAVIGAVGQQSISAEYCNTKYLRGSSYRNWLPCCLRKPVFLVGVREDKSLTMRVDFENPAEADAEVRISLTGFQGNGCCG